MEDTSPKPADPTNGQHPDVVVVEDDPFISRMYQIKLAKAGYNIAMGGNGHEAITLIKQHQPKLVLIDINMPELGGIEAIKQLKDGGYDFSRTSVVFLTNSNNPNDIESAKGLGADYLIKADQTPRGVLELIRKKLGQTSA